MNVIKHKPEVIAALNKDGFSPPTFSVICGDELAYTIDKSFYVEHVEGCRRWWREVWNILSVKGFQYRSTLVNVDGEAQHAFIFYLPTQVTQGQQLEPPKMLEWLAPEIADEPDPSTDWLLSD